MSFAHALDFRWILASLHQGHRTRVGHQIRAGKKIRSPAADGSVFDPNPLILAAQLLQCCGTSP